jgi:hypothetical protein
MNTLKDILIVTLLMAMSASVSYAGKDHGHKHKKGQHHAEKKECSECKGKKDCTCEKHDDDHAHKEGEKHHSDEKKDESKK